MLHSSMRHFKVRQVDCLILVNNIWLSLLSRRHSNIFKINRLCLLLVVSVNLLCWQTNCQTQVAQVYLSLKVVDCCLLTLNSLLWLMLVQCKTFSWRHRHNRLVNNKLLLAQDYLVKAQDYLVNINKVRLAHCHHSKPPWAWVELLNKWVNHHWILAHSWVVVQQLLEALVVSYCLLVV